MQWMKIQWPKSMGDSKNSSKREIHSDTDLPRKTRKFSNKQLKLTPKELENDKQSSNWIDEGNNKDQIMNKGNRI